MANVGFFARLGNLWKGFLSIWISDVEKEHPEIAYENAINSMVEKYTKLKTATASIIRRREDIDERLKKATRELAQTEAELNAAVETGQDDLAVILIQKKNQLEADITEMKADMDTASKDAESAKASLVQVQAEIKKLKAEKDNMLAKMASAQARSAPTCPAPVPVTSIGTMKMLLRLRAGASMRSARDQARRSSSIIPRSRSVWPRRLRDAICARAEVKNHYALNYSEGGELCAARGMGVRFVEFVRDVAEVRIGPCPESFRGLQALNSLILSKN